jgi:hypothetical protein
MENIQEISLDTPSMSMKEINLGSQPISDSNLGNGIELLMNEKVKQNQIKSPSNTIDADLKELENFNLDSMNNVENENITLNNDYKKKDSYVNKPAFDIAKGSVKLNEPVESWDGFRDINDINIEKETKTVKNLSEQELLKSKFEILRKLDALENKGATLSKKYTMDNDLDEMKGEYEFLVSEKEKENSIKFQGKILSTMITGIEFLNEKFDPFDIKLDGWSEQINENVDDYDEIFRELHEKYKSKAKMAPEIKLLFQLASSGIMVHMTNTMFKSSLPGMDDIMRQNPDLMNQFTKAAVNSMQNTNPGLNNFLNEFDSSPQSGASRQGASFQSRTKSSMPDSYTDGDGDQSMRPDMSGPNIGNIDSILNELGNSKNVSVENNSTISVEDIDSLKSSRKKSGRRGSDKNTISLAI